MLEEEILNGDIDPRRYYPPDVYREPQKAYPKDYTIDVRELALVKAKKAQSMLSAKAARLQAVIEAIEGQETATGRRCSVDIRCTQTTVDVIRPRSVHDHPDE